MAYARKKVSRPGVGQGEKGGSVGGRPRPGAARPGASQGAPSPRVGSARDQGPQSGSAPQEGPAALLPVGGVPASRSKRTGVFIRKDAPGQELKEPSRVNEDDEALLEDPPDDSDKDLDRVSAEEAQSLGVEEDGESDEEEGGEGDEEERPSQARVRQATKHSDRGARSAPRDPDPKRSGPGTARRGEAQGRGAGERSERAAGKARGSQAGRGSQSARGSRTGSVRRSQRASGPPISKKKLILGAVTVLVLGVLYISYPHFMKSRAIAKLDSVEAGLQEKGEAVESLRRFASGRGEGSISEIMRTLKSRVLTPNEALKAVPEKVAETRQAAVKGLVDYYSQEKAEKPHGWALEALCEILQSSEEEARLPLTAFLPDLARHAREGNQAPEMEKWVAALLSPAKASKDAGLRLAAVRSLGELPAKGGGCATLLQIAKGEGGQVEQGPLREAALAGIEKCAMADAVGELLKFMMDESDPTLAREARKGFAKVRESAPTAQLTAELGNPSEPVRLEIVKALASRGNDSEARDGILKALSDQATGIRIEALKAVPGMNFLYDQLLKLRGVINDADPNVQIAAAETLGKLRDEGTYKLVLERLKQPPGGKVLEAFLKTMGSRGKEWIRGQSRKDPEAIATVMELLDKVPEAGPAISGALAGLTFATGRESRETQRASWTPEQWKAWHAVYKERAAIEKSAMEVLLEADKKRDIKYKDQFAKLYQDSQSALEKLEKCKEKCNPNDPEDVSGYDRRISQFQNMIYHFQKNQALDLRH